MFELWNKHMEGIRILIYLELINEQLNYKSKTNIIKM